ncbi:MAG: 3-hydroxy-3-methylglutaryl-CoA reductase, partial [Bellilinea sp.]|nr:3-hydroxy-3-methylglutaryl-CoA reductase [Bellilinea sp.]
MPEKSGAKFYDLPPAERLKWLAQQTQLDEAALQALSGAAGLTIEQADHMIENVIGVYGLPLGVARYFIVNGREVLVPMALEEPSVVASASFMAKLARSSGGFFASADPPEMIGQIQILGVADAPTARLRLLEAREELLAEAAQIDPVLAGLGGGPRGLEVRIIQDSPIGTFLVLHLIYDVRDAMGAN